jgi:hypothetical protein
MAQERPISPAPIIAADGIASPFRNPFASCSDAAETSHKGRH